MLNVLSSFFDIFISLADRNGGAGVGGRETIDSVSITYLVLIRLASFWPLESILVNSLILITYR